MEQDCITGLAALITELQAARELNSDEGLINSLQSK